MGWTLEAAGGRRQAGGRRRAAVGGRSCISPPICSPPAGGRSAPRFEAGYQGW
jgi:hypothetical protein